VTNDMSVLIFSPHKHSNHVSHTGSIAVFSEISL